MPISLLDQLVEALRCLPSVGPKSAQRMAHHLLERDRERGRRLAETLAEALQRIGPCTRCRTLTEHEVCDLCANPNRDDELLCVVESPGDVRVIEQAVDYRGRYFVLGGRLSPVDGLGPAELGLDLLEQRLAEGVVREVVLSTNPTLEGQATAQFIAEICARHEVQATRIAYGVPLGSELEFIDGGTLAHAFAGRAKLGG